MIVARKTVLTLALACAFVSIVRAALGQQAESRILQNVESQRVKLEQNADQMERELNRLTIGEPPGINDSANHSSEFRSLQNELMLSRSRVDAELDKIKLQLEDEFKRQQGIAKKETDAVSGVDRHQGQPEISADVNTTETLSLPDQSLENKPKDPAIANRMLSGTGLISSEIVDRLKLADNLYSIGEFQNALTLYQELNSEAATGKQADSLWIKYQIASCHRHLKHVAESEKLLRDLANESGNELPIRAARWWLSAIEKRKNMEREIALIQQHLSGFEAEQKAVEVP